MENNKVTMTFSANIGKSDFGNLDFSQVDYTKQKQSNLIFGDFSEVVLCDLSHTQEEIEYSKNNYLKEINKSYKYKLECLFTSIKKEEIIDFIYCNDYEDFNIKLDDVFLGNKNIFSIRIIKINNNGV